MTEESKLHVERLFAPHVEHDEVTNPSHYQGIKGLEVEKMLRSYYKGKILKYLLHERKNNGLEDLKKARQHLDWLIDLEETHDTH